MFTKLVVSIFTIFAREVFFKVPPTKAARSPQFSPAQGNLSTCLRASSVNYLLITGSPLQSAPVQGKRNDE